MATWHVLIEGIDGMILGFPATFQFPWIFGFKNFSFSFILTFLSFPAPSVCLSCLFLRLFRFCSGDFNLALATNFSGLDYSAFQGTLLLRFFSDPFSLWPLYKFLIFPLSFAFVVFVFDMWAFRVGYPFSWLVLLRFG